MNLVQIMNELQTRQDVDDVDVGGDFVKPVLPEVHFFAPLVEIGPIIDVH